MGKKGDNQPEQWLPPQSAGGFSEPIEQPQVQQQPVVEQPAAAVQQPTFQQPAGTGMPMNQSMPQFQQPPSATQTPAGWNTAQPTFVGDNSYSNGRSVATLVLGIVGLVTWLIGIGLLFFWASLPCSIIAWCLGPKAKRDSQAAGSKREYDKANVGFILGIVGTVLAVLSLIAWIILIVLSDGSTFDTYDSSPGEGELTSIGISLLSFLVN